MSLKLNDESEVICHLMATTKQDTNIEYKDVNFCFRKRYAVTFLTFVGMVCVYVMRMNLSIAVLDMTSEKNITLGNETVIKKAEFDWNSREKGLVLSFFFYGYLFSPLGGYLSTKFGGCTMLGLAVSMTAVLTILTPILLRLNFFVFVIARILEGLFESFAIPALIEIFVHWAPSDEMSRMLLLAFNGTAIGYLISNPVSALILSYFGWPAIFFITGSASLIWYFIWFMIISDYPAEDKFITRQEQNYLKQLKRTSSVDKSKSYPWKAIITSKPLWVLMNENFSGAWSYSFVTVCLPFYIKDMYDNKINQIALLSSIPCLCASFAEISAAFVSDYLRSRSKLRIANIHRICLAIGQLSIFVSLIIMGLWANFAGSMICITLMRMFYGISNVSYETMPIDMFGGYASLVRGMGITAFSLGNLLNTTVMGFMVTNHIRTEWNLYFLVISVFNISSLIIFFIYGSGELQSWANTSKTVNVKKEEILSTN